MSDIPDRDDGLTVSEKAALTSGYDTWTTERNERAGIPAMWLSDGPHGLRVQDGTGDSLALHASRAATCFPPAVTLACTWDAALLERVAAAIAAEAKAFGVDIVLGPGINIKRSPLGGRNFEYFSEDPLLAAECGGAMVRGLQRHGVGAALKHFAANNQETDRMRVSADIDERPLREIYLRAFEHVVRKADPWTVMSAYNAVNGVSASENHRLLTEILRDEWGFDGVVMSDWGAVRDRVAALRAGLDLQMPATDGRGDAEVEAAVTDGSLEAEVLDRSAARLTALARRTRAHRGGPDPAPTDETPHDTHHELAREAAGRGIVLLKNEDATLPLDPNAGTVAVLGELARTPRFQGGGSSQVTPTRLETPLEHVETHAGAEQVCFAAGYALPEDEAADAGELRDEAVRAAADADVTLLFLGLPVEEESEGFDRQRLDLPPEQTALLERVLSVTERVVVVLANGGPVRVTPWSDRVLALVESWLLGQACGAAIADVLFGAVNPSGKLAETIPLRLEDTPAHLNFPGEEGHVRYGEGVFVGYRGYDAAARAVAFPFGHGLSYTEFTYGQLDVGVSDGTVTARLTVSNAGARAGREVVQLYAVPPTRSAVARPKRELRAFADVTLDPGQSEDVLLRFPVGDLAYYSVREQGWHVPGGGYRIEVGASSRDIRLTADLDLAGDASRAPLTRMSTLAEWQTDPVGGPLLAAAFAEVTSADAGDAAAETAGLLDDPAVRRMAEQMPLAAIVEFPGSPLTEACLTRLLDDLAAARKRG